MGYRPLCDFWFLARAKLKGGRKYYGAYLGGFPERARAYLAATIDDPVLHVCGGMARYYPYRGGFGPNDKTLDLAPETEPDFLQDALDKHPKGFRAKLIDPPYSEDDAEQYAPGRTRYPRPNALMAVALENMRRGERVGIIHYILPSVRNTKFITAVGICCGFNNRIRVYSVFEKL